MPLYVDTLELTYIDGTKYSSSLEEVDYDSFGPIIKTPDPRWIISTTPTRQVWMGVMGFDRQLWWTRVRAQYDPGLNVIKMWYESRGPGPAPHGDPEQLPELPYGPSDKDQIGYFDWSGRKTHAWLRSVAPRQKPRWELHYDP